MRLLGLCHGAESRPQERALASPSHLGHLRRRARRRHRVVWSVRRRVLADHRGHLLQWLQLLEADQVKLAHKVVKVLVASVHVRFLQSQIVTCSDLKLLKKNVQNWICFFS
jgi:hypothetical protein